MFLQYLTFVAAAVCSYVAPAVTPFILAFAIGSALAKLCISRSTAGITIMLLIEAGVLGAFMHEDEVHALLLIVVLGVLVETACFCYKLWNAGLLAHLLHQRQLQMVISSTVSAIADLPPGGKAVFYFYPQVDSFTQEVARLYAGLGWVVGLGRIATDSRHESQIVMAVQAPLDPVKLKTSLFYLRRAGALRIKAG